MEKKMSNDSTTVDAGSTTNEVDDFDLSAEDNVATNPAAPTDDQQTDDAATTSADDDNLASDKSDKKADDADDKSADDTTKPDDKPPAFDPDLDDWAVKTGHEKPESDRERKLMQDLRNSRREFTRERQAEKASKNLQDVIKETNDKTTTKPADDADPALKEAALARAEIREERGARLQSEYFTENGLNNKENAPVVEAMVAILKEEGEKDIDSFNFLSNPKHLAKLHTLAKDRVAADATTDTSDVAEKARADERERIAKESKAAGPSKSAKSTQTKEKKSELDALWESDD